MHLFYSPQFSEINPYLSEEESWHCCKVLRMELNDEIWVTNGLGLLSQCQIKKVDLKKTELKILSSNNNYGKRNFSIHLAIAPTKNIDRMEWLVEKCVEIGIDEISFLQCQRSERKIIKTDRLKKIAIEAMKQSIKAYFPKINELQTFESFVSQNNFAKKFVAHLEEGKKVLLSKIINQNENYCILIGPEGDFSMNEINLAIKHNFEPVTLGESRLRTETAGLMACQTFHIVNQLT